MSCDGGSSSFLEEGGLSLQIGSDFGGLRICGFYFPDFVRETNFCVIRSELILMNYGGTMMWLKSCLQRLSYVSMGLGGLHLNSA